MGEGSSFGDGSGADTVGFNVGGENNVLGSGEAGLLIGASGVNFGGFSIDALMRCCFAFARSAIHEGCDGGGAAFGFSSFCEIFDSSQLDLVGLQRLEGLGGDVRSPISSSPVSEIVRSDAIDFERL